MNAMAEKLEAAGVDTIGARLTTACTEALRKHPESSVDAWRYVGTIFGHEFIRGLMQDMKTAPGKEPTPPPTPLSRDNHSIGGPAPYKPRVIPKERLERSRQMQQAIRSKYKNSGGISWSDVGWHELRGLKRDGAEAEALFNAGPANVPNDGRSVGDVLGIEKTNEVIAGVRK
jgi:hypothetical protein